MLKGLNIGTIIGLIIMARSMWTKSQAAKGERDAHIGGDATP